MNPKVVVKSPAGLKKSNRYWQSLFLGGGISNCPDWQAEMEDKLTGLPLVLLNPRRDVFDINDPTVSVQQIEWEYRHLRLASLILFWFPEETLCPITLLELGYWLGQTTKLFVGVHPNYRRKLDVEIQTGLERPEVKVAYSLDDLASQVWDHCGYDRGTGYPKTAK